MAINDNGRYLRANGRAYQSAVSTEIQFQYFFALWRNLDGGLLSSLTNWQMLEM